MGGSRAKGGSVAAAQGGLEVVAAAGGKEGRAMGGSAAKGGRQGRARGA